MVDLAVLPLDRRRRGHDLHLHTATVAAAARAQPPLDDRKDALVVAAERAEVLVDHVQLVDDLKRRAGVVRGLGRANRQLRLRVALRSSLVALAAAPVA